MALGPEDLDVGEFGQEVRTLREEVVEDAYTADTLAHMARALGGDRADAVLAHYANTGMTPYEAIADLITAGVWHEPAEATLERFAALGRTCYLLPLPLRTGLPRRPADRLLA